MARLNMLRSATVVPAAPANAVSAPGGGRLRWGVCALLFLATTLNYADRQVLGVLKPTLMGELHWSEIDYSDIVMAFSAAYAVGYALGGWLMDRVGVRLGLALCVVGWSVASGGHAFVRTVAGFCAMRIALGLAEGGNFPAAVKAVGEWFPRRDRAFAIGVFNAGCNVAVVITPLLTAWLTLRYGWPAAFLVLGAVGLVWGAGWWWLLYRAPGSTLELPPGSSRTSAATHPNRPAGWGGSNCCGTGRRGRSSPAW